MKSEHFWTPEEDKALETCLKRFKTTKEAALWLCRKINRSYQSVYVRMLSFKRSNGLAKPRKKHETKIKPSESSGIVVPQGTSFEGNAKRVELHQDHFRIFF